MNDLISRKKVLALPRNKVRSLRTHEVVEETINVTDIEHLPSAQPDNQTNLCDSCDCSYPDCPSKYDDVIFGNGIGNDNICACNKYKPSAQPELTDEQSIAHLQSSGWMQRHDKEMYESGLKEQLADDSDSYDSLLPTVQPEPKWIPCSERLPSKNGKYIVTEKRYAVDDKNHDGKYNVIVEEVYWYGKWDRAKFFEVTAWMFLPEPYNEGEQNG